ncbi:ZIP zinc transporter-domain-containing protein [Helicostylum pulchrum]|uniref:Zinc/iron permease n=1 Tax=Helicostylum pulchrum TaxID=562976 RepID=A0ABP9XNJ7_9FUNG|nr:ZIP zinc transporter-domain-containing protein [Helicostylum pulchrum]
MSFQADAFAFLFPGSAMTNSILATAYISIFPNLLLYFVPPDINTGSLNVLVSFAVGGLLGDVFLHLLPHAFLGEHAEENAVVVVNNQKNVLIGLGIFAGLFFFFFMDKMMRVLNGGSGHDHSHDHKKNDDAPDNKKTEGSIKLSAYLNLLADFTHNMTDGLAMAASFYASPAVGATTAVAVFFHEIPHEVGDYAILIQSGFSKQKAMMAQFTTAIGAFLGTFIGILIEESSLSNKAADEKAGITDVVGLMGTDLRWGDLVIPFAAGGFMYIATVGVIPELLEVTGNIKKDRKQAIMEFMAMFVGLGLMLFIAWNDIPA